jgi:hypothetical protein
MRLSDEERNRVQCLPRWTQDIIKRLETATEPLVEEVAKARMEVTRLRKQCQQYKDAKDALMELLGCAGRNDIDWAAKVVETLEGYAIFKEGGNNEAQ